MRTERIPISYSLLVIALFQVWVWSVGVIEVEPASAFYARHTDNVRGGTSQDKSFPERILLLERLDEHRRFSGAEEKARELLLSQVHTVPDTALPSSAREQTRVFRQNLGTQTDSDANDLY